jgi:hypothetical protein
VNTSLFISHLTVFVFTLILTQGPPGPPLLPAQPFWRPRERRAPRSAPQEPKGPRYQPRQRRGQAPWVFLQGQRKQQRF